MTPLPLFYSGIAVLDRNVNNDLRIESRQAPYAFAARSHILPALAQEFFAGCRDMPIVFLEEGGTWSPLFLVGMRSNENVFVDREGRWLGQYVPAYLRRYPFISGETPEQQVICFDPGYAGLGVEAGDRLFGHDGEPTATLNTAIAMVAEYSQAATITAAFSTQLKELDLLRTINIEMRAADGSTATFYGFAAVDEQKLASLADDALLDLQRKGYLAFIYAHLISMGNLQALSARAPTPAAGAETRERGARLNS
ncbi:SapC family protein [Terrarubrum flagellatum]|uniref:SapC family protein n=1 Tax=Terrirubrum flagellatum TaxID=2895980 RepID=UPI003145492F